ncbi:MAG: AAA family ATPase [Myxococcota bacterium]
MRIKRLEIFGFKSFADRAVIHFDAGVTGIVGPNGCGKSNVVDALRWVMGEQNAKHLRGDQMQDIIFNGSQNRGPMGLAEVSLTLENDGQLVPSEYSHFDEIEVTRRLYRNGDSEYEINKRTCRLRDITEFFLGTGVGTKAYSIIEQGRVASLVQAKPEDRRQIIEEAAGITKYKMRKLAAERKMDSTSQNLLRINDITKEVEQRLGSLEKQAQKAERFQNLNAQIRDFELHEASIRFFDFTNQAQFHRIQHSAAEEALLNQLEAIASHEAAVQTERDLLNDAQQKLNLTQSMIQAVDSSIALSQRDIQFTESTLASKQKQALHTADETKRIEQRLLQLNAEKEQLALQKQTVAAENANVEQRVSIASANLQQLTATRAGYHQTTNLIQSKIMQAAREATQAQGEINSRIQQREQAKQREKTLEQETALLKTQLEAADSQRQSLAADIQKTNEEKQSRQIEISAAQTALSELNNRLNEANQSKQKLAASLASKQGRLSALIESLKDPKRPEHAGLKRAGELVDIPESFESLIEDACGDRLEAYLVQDLLTGLELSQKGRLRFFTDTNNPLKFDIVENTEEALVKWPKARQEGIILITKSGELYDIDGSCVAGDRVKSAGLLVKKREIAALQAELTTLQSELESSTLAIEVLTKEQQSTRDQLDALKTQQQTISLSAARLEEALKNRESSDKSLRSRISALESESAKLQVNPAYSEDQLKALQDKWALALEVHQKLEMDLSAHQLQMTQFETDFAAQSEAFTHIRIEAASAKERLSHLTRSEQQTTQNIEDIRLQIQNLSRQLSELSEDEIQLHAQAKLAAEKIETATKELAALKQNQIAEQESCAKQRQVLAGLEAGISKQRQDIDALQKLTHKLLLEIREAELSLEAVNKRLYDKYQLLPAQIIHDYHHKNFDAETSEAELKTLKRQLDNLGPINQGAIEEFAELGKRYTFLSTQSEDLANALGQLEAAIQKINETTKQRFEEAFNAINERFSQVFPRLFRGGKAWLELTNPADLLNTGVEIFAQPPGKKLASIALMSGGEKALTATSLIFSIFLIKPSPFCLLDEVDAPLDEANVDRFSQMVAEMSKISQFIVITHNKRTMEKADQLYGVTMEQAGISRTVHVQVNDRAPAPTPAESELWVQ